MNKTARALFIASAFLTLDACSSSRAPATGSPGGGSATTVFGDALSLTGYNVGNKEGHTEVELHWRALRKIPADYVVFVHAVDASGGIVFQLDHWLKNASGSPTSLWGSGDVASDRFLASPPAGHSQGPYTLRLGLYIPKPFTMVPVTRAALPEPTDAWKKQAVLLPDIDCR